jgi:sortase A
VRRSGFDPVQAVARFCASVLMVSGVLLIADAGITLAWQEPISAITAGREQAKLEDEITKPKVRARVIARKPLPGEAIGRIVIPAIDRRYWVVEGTAVDDLKKGPGHYSDTPLPGEDGTVAIAGHRTTHGAPFRKIDQLDRGDEVRVEVPYGTFVYAVETSRIVDPTEISVKRPVAHDRLILSACHPLYSAAERIVVFARFVRRTPARVS